MKTALLLFLLALVGFGGVAWVMARLNGARAEGAFPPEGQILDIDGHAVHAVVRGTGPDLVLLHGSAGNARDFTFDLVDRLSPHYRVIAFDRPGLGHTDPMGGAGASLREQAALLARAADRLGARKPVVLGHSYGGAVALAWAVHQRSQISGLVLLSAPSQPWEGTSPLLYRALSHPLAGPVLATVMGALSGEPRIQSALSSIFDPQSPPEGYRAHIGPGLTLRPASLRANAQQRVSLLPEIRAMQPLYDRIDVPVEILHGTADTTVGLSIHAEPLAQDLPRARLTRLEGVGHMPQHAKQAEVIAAIARAADTATAGN